MKTSPAVVQALRMLHCVTWPSRAPRRATWVVRLMSVLLSGRVLGCSGDGGRVPQDLVSTEHHPVILEEEALYQRVREHLSQVIVQRAGAMNLDRELVALRDQIAEARLEDVAPLVEHMYRTAALASHRGIAITPPPDPRSPYFGHMSLREGDRDREVLLGKRSHIDQDAGVIIVDWRNAPVSRIFYRYEEGDSYEEPMAGRVAEGVVTARRTVSIYNGVLRRITYPDGSYVRRTDGRWRMFGGEEAQLAGGQRTALRPSAESRGAPRGQARQRLGVTEDGMLRPDKHLPEIAALLDPAQFGLITGASRGVMVLAGGAGSGKTTVALHRIAYLHFQDPTRFRPRNMLVVVPQRGLVEYVSRVLPGLEVERVEVTTWLSWARHTRHRMLPQLRWRTVDEVDERVAAVKKHPGMLAVIDRYVTDQTAQFRAELRQALSHDGDVALVLEAFEQGEATPLASRLQAARARAATVGGRARDAVIKVLALAMRRVDDILADWADICSDPVRLREGLAATASPPDPRSIDATVRATLAQLERPEEVLDAVDEERRIGVDGRSEDPGLAGRLDPCDEALLLRLWQVKHGDLTTDAGKPIRYDHVTVDEAQDFSPLEIQVLLAQSREQTMTLAGDMAQKIVFDTGVDSWEALLQALGCIRAEVQTLELAYRSTVEVMTLAHDVLGPLAPVTAPACTRHGAAVELFRFSDPGEVVAFLGEALRSLMLRERAANVAVLARFAAQADLIHEGLARAEVPRLRRVRAGDFSFSPGVDVTDVTSAKGLEYDYIVLVDVDGATYPDTLECRHLLHVAVTRAVHQLWLTCTGEPSPLLPGWLVEDS
ncbi:MAG: ATP-binding domain-containing protein [Pseudomonadota bacterium]